MAENEEGCHGQERLVGQGWQGRRGVSPCWGCAKERPRLTFRVCVLGRLRKQVPSQAASGEDKENGKASTECRKTGQAGGGELECPSHEHREDNLAGQGQVL